MKLKAYVTEKGEIFIEGEILMNYDRHGTFIEYVKINKFIEHKKKDGQKYLCVNFQSIQYATKNWTLNIDCLGKNYKKFDS